MPLSTSVVIPCYNGQDFLWEALESIHLQTVPVQEIVVVDDGSRVPIEKPPGWQGPDLRIIRTRNQGIGAARNVGIAHCSSDLIAFLDSDDLWQPRYIEEQTIALLQNSHAVASFAQCASKQGFFGFGPYPPPDVSEDEFLLVLWYSHFFPPSAVVVRRDVLLEVGAFRDNLSNGEDIELWLRLLARGSFVQVPEPLCEYRQHDQQFTKNIVRKMFGSKQARRTMIEQHADRLMKAGIPYRRLWDSYRNDILLVYYRRDFTAARRLLWDYWLEHPSDLHVLKCALIALLPSRFVRWLRGDVPLPVMVPAGGSTSGWKAIYRRIQRVLGH